MYTQYKVIQHTEYQGFYAFVVLNKTMFVVSPNKPIHVFRSQTPRVSLFCQMVIMLHLHNTDPEEVT